MKLLRYMVAICMCLCVLLTGCGTDSTTAVSSEAETTQYAVHYESEPAGAKRQAVTDATKENEPVRILITIGDETLTAVLEDNSSAEAFIALLRQNPVTVKMSDYAGMEKVGALGTSLPRNDTQLDVTAGDVILYQGNQITIYYGTNSWNFTRLAKIEDASGEWLKGVLGDGDVDVIFSIE